MYVIIVTSNSCDPFNVGKIYNSEKEAEKGVKKEQRGWDNRDWYKLECNIVKLKENK
jgi:hypothetical protein